MAPPRESSPSQHLVGAPVSLDWCGDDDPGHDLIVEGHGRIERVKHGPLVAHESIVGPADAESLARAARDPRRCCSGLPEEIAVAVGDPDGFDPNLWETDHVSLEVDEDHAYACVDMVVRAAEGGAATYRRLLERVVLPLGCEVASVCLLNEYAEEVDEWGNDVDSDPSWVEVDRAAQEEAGSQRPRCLIHARIAPRSSMVVADLLAAGRAAHVFLTALQGGAFGLDGALHILRAGCPKLLVGEAESAWLEVKGRPYLLSASGGVGTAAKIELAQDVARFANGQVDALLVIGLTTGKEGGDDVIREVTPAPLSQLNVGQYRQVIDARVYPAPVGLDIERIDLEEGTGLLLIRVPAQAAEVQPFLVHGAIVDDRAEGTFISIVQRRGEGSITLGPSHIHSMIVAGRAFLRSANER